MKYGLVYNTIYYGGTTCLIGYCRIYYHMIIVYEIKMS